MFHVFSLTCRQTSPTVASVWPISSYPSKKLKTKIIFPTYSASSQGMKVVAHFGNVWKSRVKGPGIQFGRNGFFTLKSRHDKIYVIQSHESSRDGYSTRTVSVHLHVSVCQFPSSNYPQARTILFFRNL